jgi:hypothetical protein
MSIWKDTSSSNFRVVGGDLAGIVNINVERVRGEIDRSDELKQRFAP